MRETVGLIGAAGASLLFGIFLLVVLLRVRRVRVCCLLLLVFTLLVLDQCACWPTTSGVVGCCCFARTRPCKACRRGPSPRRKPLGAPVGGEYCCPLAYCLLLPVT